MTKSKGEGTAVLDCATEISPLLGSLGSHAYETQEDFEPEPSGRVQLGKTATSYDAIKDATWKQEARIGVAYAAPLVVTFILQYSIDVSSVIVAGRLGKVELGAVSLANMSAIITCLAPFQGLTTALDTLCSQAYGSGEKKLVGLYCQRMMLILLVLSVPITVLWAFSERIFLKLLPEVETAILCSQYLKILMFAVPGYGAFEVGRRFLQAQGLFRATTYILLVSAPLHVALLWLFTYKLELGFVGAPISVAITRTLIPLLLMAYVQLVSGKECWGGFNKRVFLNIGTMLRLAIPGMIMVEAEMLCFEIMTIVSSQFGVDYLAAQSIFATIATLSGQIPLSLASAASTRVATLIGAGRINDAKRAAKVGVMTGTTFSLLNFLAFVAFRFNMPYVFTTDAGVAAIVTSGLPLLGLITFLDGFVSAANGVLRGIGKQMIGGPTNIFSYYAIALPISLGLAFGLQWKVEGLWMGCAVGMTVVCIVEYPYLIHVNWSKSVEEAATRTAQC